MHGVKILVMSEDDNSILLRCLLLKQQQLEHKHGMYCHDQEVMNLNPDRVELGVFYPKSYLNQKYL